MINYRKLCKQVKPDMFKNIPGEYLIFSDDDVNTYIERYLSMHTSYIIKYFVTYEQGIWTIEYGNVHRDDCTRESAFIYGIMDSVEESYDEKYKSDVEENKYTNINLYDGTLIKYWESVEIMFCIYIMINPDIPIVYTDFRNKLFNKSLDRLMRKSGK